MGLGQKDPVLSPGDSCYLEWALYPASAGTCLQHMRQKMQGEHELNLGERLIIHPPSRESPGRICLPGARSIHSQTQLPFIPRQVRGQFLKHCWSQQRWCAGLIFLDLLIQPVSLAFRGESGQEALNDPKGTLVGLEFLMIISSFFTYKTYWNFLCASS